MQIVAFLTAQLEVLGAELLDPPHDLYEIYIRSELISYGRAVAVFLILLIGDPNM